MLEMLSASAMRWMCKLTGIVLRFTGNGRLRRGYTLWTRQEDGDSGPDCDPVHLQGVFPLVLPKACKAYNAVQVIYAAQLIYITTNALTKCSVALLLARLILLRSRLIVCYGLVAVSALWGLASFLVIAIKCTDRPPWVLVGPGKCVNTVRQPGVIERDIKAS